MSARNTRPLPPFQYSIGMMLVLMLLAALFCSAAAVLGWSGSLIGLAYPLACFLVYQLAYAVFARWFTRGSWDGAFHGLTAILSLAVVGGFTGEVLVIIGVAMG